MPLTISVVTPSFNQAEFLPRALASVGGQTVRPVEHLVFDPGSTDASRDIARAAPGVTLVAEPDQGQADAVARGMLAAKGDIIAWLNSDDEYYDGSVFAQVLEAFESDLHPDIVFGDGEYIGRDGEFLREAYVVKNVGALSWRLAKETGILQPAAFISKALIERIGPADPTLQFCMDYEFWIRAQKAGAKFMRIDRKLARARYYADNKTLGRRGESLLEIIRMVKKNFGFAHYEWLVRLADFEIFNHDGILETHIGSGKDARAIPVRAAELNRLCNGDYKTVSRLIPASGERLFGPTPLLFKHGSTVHAAAYVAPVAPDAPGAPNGRSYCVGTQKWAFDKTWLTAELDRSEKLIERLKTERAGDICVIVGNGPSLRNVDLRSMEGVDVFVTNYAIFNKELGELAKYLCVTNYLVAEQECERFNLLDRQIKFVPYWLAYCLLPTPNTCYLRSVGRAEFSIDLQKNISWRSTVSFFAMQIAYALGYRKVLLTGFDHYYVQPELAEGELIDQRGDDPNHFDPGYFKGKTWQAADTAKMEEMYRLASAAFEGGGREIVNCTIGGRLEVFRRSDLEVELKSQRAAALDLKERKIRERRDLIAALPHFLKPPQIPPPDRPDLDAEVCGLRKVVDLYRHRLDGECREKMRALRNVGKGRRCFMLGDDPAVERMNLSKLKGEATFVADGFATKLAGLDWAPTFYLVADRSAAEKHAAAINALDGPMKLVPAYLGDVIEPGERTIFFDHRPADPADEGFNFDPGAEIFGGAGAAIVGLELAAYFGFEEIYLIGVDGAGRLSGAYEAARRACEARGVRIFNAVQGRKSDLFPRVNFHSLFGEKSRPPRLLLIDHTRIGDGTATGEVKAALLADWPREALLQLAAIGPETVTLSSNGARVRLDGEPEAVSEAVWRRIAAFDPEIVLYRPAPGADRLHSLAKDIIETTGLPLAVWIMDDWPTALAAADPEAFSALDADLHRLVARAERRFSICDEMSREFEKRYDAPFEAFANGVDPNDWPPPRISREKTFRLRYAGSLAANMTSASLRLVARAVERLAGAGRDIVFEIKTRDHWRELAGPDFADCPHTKFVVEEMSRSNYRHWLSGADAVVIAYNFDPESVSYVRYSMANKLPECMACGAPVFAVGPKDVATLAYLEDIDCGVRINEPNAEAIVAALNDLIDNPSSRLVLAERARQLAFDRHNIHAIRTSFMRALVETAQAGKHSASLSREAGAQVDETAVVARLLSDRRGSNHVMLDVGAHHGASAGHFHELGWTAYCFEPDPANRKKLAQRFADAANIRIDPRALSDRPAKEAVFFSSTESTGISGLHAFHASHRESARVEVTTIADVVRSQGLSHVDFLKIDAEGLDFMVLKGAPWDGLKPDIIECEFEDAKTVPLGHGWRDIADFLRDKGYAVYVSEWHPIIRYGIAHDWRRVAAYPGVEVAADAWGNLLAFRDDPGYEEIRRAFNADLKLKGAPMEDAGINQAKEKTASPLAMEKSTRITDAAHAIHRISPRLYAILRFAKRMLAHIWRRKTWTLPLALAFAGTIAAGLHPALASARLALWLGAGLGAVVLAVAYLAFRTHALIERLSGENAALSAASSKTAKVHAALREEVKTEGLAVRSELAERDKKFSDLQNRQTLSTDAKLLQLRTLIQGTDDRLRTLIQGTDDRLRTLIQGTDDRLGTLIQNKDDRMKAVAERVTKFGDRVNRADKRIEKVERIAEGKVIAIEARVIEVAKLLQGMLDRSNDLARSYSELEKRDAAETARLEKEASSLRAELDAKIKEAKATAVSAAEFGAKEIERLEKASSTLRAEIDAKIKKVTASAIDAARLEKEASSLRAELNVKIKEANTAAIDAASGNTRFYQRFNRRLDDGHVDEIIKNWRRRLSVNVSRQTLGYMAHRACHIESSLHGRLAASIEDILLRTLIAMAVKNQDLNVLEIGTLFGTGAAIMYDALAPRFRSVHLTLLDPLEGYYAITPNDGLTGAPVNEAILLANLRTAGVKAKDLTVIKRMSTDPEALAEAGRRQYDVLVIDADHSYAGVKTDFENYAPLVKVGGYVIFDDYNAADWPDVTRYVDAEVASTKFVAHVGTAWRTCVYRVVKEPPEQIPEEEAAPQEA